MTETSWWMSESWSVWGRCRFLRHSHAIWRSRREQKLKLSSETLCEWWLVSTVYNVVWGGCKSRSGVSVSNGGLLSSLKARLMTCTASVRFLICRTDSCIWNFLKKMMVVSQTPDFITRWWTNSKIKPCFSIFKGSYLPVFWTEYVYIYIFFCRLDLVSLLNYFFITLAN